jgi:hypothetical protein
MSMPSMSLQLNKWLVTIILAIFVGPLFGVLPLASWTGFLHSTGALRGGELNWTGVYDFPKSFTSVMLGSYFFALPIGLTQTATIGILLSVFGEFRNWVGVGAIAAAFIAGILIGGILFWRGLICQCHPNILGSLFLSPPTFVLCYAFLATGCWLMARRIWNRPI